MLALNRLPNQPGTYLLVLACRHARCVQIGRLGRVRLEPGYYLYVGSALGPGGLRPRVRHHWRKAAQPHWHCDYLRRACVPVAVWFLTGPRRLEHAWARRLAQLPPVTVPLRGFGASDCTCAAHLFFVRTSAALARVRHHLQAASTTRIQDWGPQTSGWSSHRQLKHRGDPVALKPKARNPKHQRKSKTQNTEIQNGHSTNGYGGLP